MPTLYLSSTWARLYANEDDARKFDNYTKIQVSQETFDKGFVHIPYATWRGEYWPNSEMIGDCAHHDNDVVFEVLEQYAKTNYPEHRLKYEDYGLVIEGVGITLTGKIMDIIK